MRPIINGTVLTKFTFIIMMNNYPGWMMRDGDICRGTADDYMWPMVQAKLEVLGQLGLTRETFHEE